MVRTEWTVLYMCSLPQHRRHPFTPKGNKFSKGSVFFLYEKYGVLTAIPAVAAGILTTR